MATISFDRQIKVNENGARELSQILASKKAIQSKPVECRKATKEEIRKLLRSK